MNLTDYKRLEYRGRPPLRLFLPTAPTSGEIRLGRWAGDAAVEIVQAGLPLRPLPRQIIRHSPDGFEWGYEGSGPADLAANILALFVCWKEAWRLHQYFKEEIVARIPHDGGVISVRDARLWIASYWQSERDKGEVPPSREQADAASGHVW